LLSLLFIPVSAGFYNFHNWFDEGAWYPLGRIIGGTIYPGLMVTSAMVYWTLRALHFTVDIRNVCVLLAPWMSSNTAVATYLLTKEVKNSSAGLVAAAFIAVVPGNHLTPCFVAWLLAW
jgi:dolichyl-diphosphooligosaccharide--protein glycosyltransferase